MTEYMTLPLRQYLGNPPNGWEPYKVVDAMEDQVYGVDYNFGANLMDLRNDDIYLVILTRKRVTQ